MTSWSTGLYLLGLASFPFSLCGGANIMPALLIPTPLTQELA